MFSLFAKYCIAVSLFYVSMYSGLRLKLEPLVNSKFSFSFISSGIFN